MPKPVELHQAYMWTCEACGRDNFERAIELSPEQVAGMDLPYQASEGTWLTSPSEVTCQCGQTFEACHGDDD